MWWRRRSSFSYLIFGLGNPGNKYAHTLHNAGYRVVENLATRLGAPKPRKRDTYLYTESKYEGKNLSLIQPLTYMNRSGEAVRQALHWYRVEPEKILVIYDDMDLPPGTIRLRPRGGSGGHGGLKSIVNTLDSQEFPRLRIGIGKPPEGINAPAYVLGKLEGEMASALEDAEEKATEAVLTFIGYGIEEAMNKFNVLS